MLIEIPNEPQGGNNPENLLQQQERPRSFFLGRLITQMTGIDVEQGLVNRTRMCTSVILTLLGSTVGPLMLYTAFTDPFRLRIADHTFNCLDKHPITGVCQDKYDFQKLLIIGSTITTISFLSVFLLQIQARRFVNRHGILV